MVDPFAAIAERIEPGARLIARAPLRGGVSAQVDALELAGPGGTRRVVVRRHGAAGWKALDADVTANEFALLRALRDAGLEVPEPLLLDVSGEILPPYLVLAFVDGTTEAGPEAVPRMAAWLARLHGLDPGRMALPALPRREDAVARALEELPHAEAAVRAALEARTARPARDALLHGDFWVGNVLWDGGRIAAVLDWEDAAVGDPLSDLAGSRIEVLWRFGEAAMDAYTSAYVALTGADTADLPLWDLHVGHGAAARMGLWGLDPAVLADMRRKTAAFIARAAERVLAG